MTRTRKVALTLALVFALAVMLAGGVAVAFTFPWWAAALNGFALAFAVPSVLEATAEVWTARR